MREIAATHRGDKSPRLHWCCDKAVCASFVAAICRTTSNRFVRQNSVAATMILTCHTRRFVAATCRGDVSQRFVVSCASALTINMLIYCIQQDARLWSNFANRQIINRSPKNKEQLNKDKREIASKKLFWLIVNLANTFFHIHYCQHMEVLNGVYFITAAG